MKKVLHVLRCFSNGGTEKYVINLLKETHKKYDNFLLVYEDICCWEKELNDMNIKVFKIDSPKNAGLYKFCLSLRNIMKENNIDIVYSYTHYNSALVMICAFIENIKIRITHSHRSTSEQKKSLKYNVYRLFSRLTINIFTTNKLACSSVAGKDLFYNNFKIINNGIEIEKYKYNQKIRNELRKKLHIPEDCHVIGMIGRLDKNKNAIYMIKVFAEYNKFQKNSKLILIGDGDQKENLLSYVKEKGILDSVHFLGNKINANEYYNIFDLYTITSYKEGLPFVLIEAQTNGLKCLASDSVDNLSNITNNVVFLPLDDIDLWVNNVKENINKRHDSIEMIKKTGYSLSNTIKEVVRIYEEK